MQQKLRKFLEAERQQERKEKEIEKINIMASLGLCEVIYSEGNVKNAEYPFLRRPDKVGKYKWCKIVTPTVTDSEYEELKKYAKERSAKKKNVAAVGIKVMAWIVCTAGQLVAVAFAAEFTFAVFLGCWFCVIICGAVLFGLSEVIRLLDDIRQK